MKIKIKKNVKIREENIGGIIRIPKTNNPEMPQYFHVNRVGLEIIKMCDGEKTRDEIVMKIKSKYLKNENTEDDCNMFINNLFFLNMIDEIRG